MVQLIGIGVRHMDNLYRRVREILEEERPDGILLESQIVSLNNSGEIVNAPEGEPAERRKKPFLEQKLEVGYERYTRDIGLVRKSKKSDLWTHMEEDGFLSKTFWKLFGVERRLFQNVPAVRLDVGDFIYYDGHSFEQNSGIGYALDEGIPWYAVNTPLIAPLSNLGFLRFNGSEYSIVPCPIEREELQEYPLTNIHRVWTINGYTGGLSWQESDQIRNTYAARAAERIYGLFGHDKLAIIYGDRHFDQNSLLKQSEDGNIPNTIPELIRLNTSYRNASE